MRAPGRVNLIGEHTDCNDGFVLPCAIDFDTVVAASPRSDARLRVTALDYGAAVDEFALDAPITRRPDAPWANCVRGVVAMLQQRGLTCGLEAQARRADLRRRRLNQAAARSGSCASSGTRTNSVATAAQISNAPASINTLRGSPPSQAR